MTIYQDRQKERDRFQNIDFKIFIGYEEYNWLKTFLVENLESVYESNEYIFILPQGCETEIGIIKDIMNAMGERHSYPSTMGERYRYSSIITLTYDQIMEVADLISLRVECNYNEDENIIKNIRLLYEFDIIKEIMRSLCSTNIPSIETIRHDMEKLIDYMRPALYRGGGREMSPGKKKLVAIMCIGVLLLGTPGDKK